MRKTLNKKQKRLCATSVVAVIAFLICFFSFQLKLGVDLQRKSYDLPFLFGDKTPDERIAIVFLDESTFSELDTPLTDPLDRRWHGKLVDRLLEEGAEKIIFDIVFADSRPEQDQALAAAIEKHGDVVLAGELLGKTDRGQQQRLLLATPDLRIVAAGSGLVEVPVSDDGVVRKIMHGISTDFGLRSSLSAQAAGLSDVESEQDWRLLNYYGVSGCFPSYNYVDVLENRGLPEQAFEGKIVFIGAKQKSGTVDAGKDTFPTPLTRIAKELTPGVEIHATAASNLLGKDFLKPWSLGANQWLFAICAVVFACIGCLMKPTRGILLLILAGLGITAIGIWLHLSSNQLMAWTFPAFVQVPFVIAGSLITHYFLEYSSRWKLRKAFKSYMSEEQARLIDEDSDILELGGKEVEATVFFSDLAGFTSMSEGLPPSAVSKALISYFESATEGILNHQGTIIKYVGDAVMATWGAPLKVEEESDRAIRAAIEMQLAGRQPVVLETEEGTVERVLETRIGINSGLGLAGNLGSRRRFDYSVIGDTTNLAARLEGLNKMLGTSILVAGSVLERCEKPSDFVVRRMGEFVVKGRRQSVSVFEVMGARGGELFRKRSELYLDLYAKGLDAYEAGRLSKARDLFEQAKGKHDRKSECDACSLFLEKIEKAESEADVNWGGHVVLDSK